MVVRVGRNDFRPLLQKNKTLQSDGKEPTLLEFPNPT